MRDLQVLRRSGRIELRLAGSGASVEPAPHGWTVVLDLADRPDPHAVATTLLEGARQAVGAAGGGPLRHWVHGDGPVGSVELAADAAAAAGFTLERTLWQLRRPLPVDPVDGGSAAPLAVRAFVPGQDDEAWLEVNNRAFAAHPEQGAWTREELAERLAEPWFDPAGFLLHEADGRLAGFCWTKVHDAVEPPLGEIYVIAVDPAVHHRGLGRRLVLAGLDHLSSHGLRVGMLYVDAGNDAAVGLYHQLGFELHHADRAFAVEVAAS